MTARRVKLHFYHDPGHGWIRVKRSLIQELGIASRISPYSYQKDDMVYLEEDCDAGLLSDAMKAAGRDYEVIDHYGEADSKIRSYRSYVRG